MSEGASRIVVGVDFGPPSLAAAAWTARHLASGSAMVLVHALAPAAGAASAGEAGPADAAPLAAARLEALAHSLGVEAAVVVRAGDPAVVLAEVAASLAAELVVVGAHRDHPSPWDALGTTAERLVGRSGTPVLVAAGALTGPPRVLLVPVAADADISERAFDWACRLERRFDCKVAVVHVEGAPAPAPGWTPADAAEPERAVAREPGELPRWRRLLADRRPDRVFSDAVAGDATSGILAEAERFRSGLIVVDDRALAGARRPGSDGLLRGVARPLLVVPGSAERASARSSS